MLIWDMVDFLLGLVFSSVFINPAKPR